MMPSLPSKALIVEALARARRAVAVHQGHGRALDEWLAGEVRLRGIRENAAILAVLELRPGRREETARAYRHEHPDRAGALSGLLAVLDQPGSAAGLQGLRFQDQASLGGEPVDEPRPVPDVVRRTGPGPSTCVDVHSGPGSSLFRRGSLR